MEQIIVFDTETTGLPDWKAPSAAPHQPHIVQLAAVVADKETGRISQSMDVIIRPDGWVSEKEAIATHGITTERAMDEGVPEKTAVEMFLALWNGRLRIAYNTQFDNRIIRIATKRYCGADVIDRWHSGVEGEDWSCMMKVSHGIMGGKLPKLTEAYTHFYGIIMSDAHTAMKDAMACLAIYLISK